MNAVKIRKVTWWVAECLDDIRVYSIRGRTKAEVLAELASINLKKYKHEDYGLCWADVDTNRARFALPKKVTFEYRNTLDLVFSLLGGGGCE